MVESTDPGQRRKRQRVRLTKATVEAAAPPPGRTVYLWDDGLRGFVLRARTGVRGTTRTYLVRYTLGKGRPWMPIGRHGEPFLPDPQTGAPRVLTAELARLEALRLLGLKNGGLDPAGARRAAKSTP